MRNKVAGIIFAVSIIGFILLYQGTDGFSTLGGGGGVSGSST